VQLLDQSELCLS